MAPTVDIWVNGVQRTDLVLRSIKASLVRPYEAELYWPERHDAPPYHPRLWDQVRLRLADGTTVFRGNVTAFEPGGLQQEGLAWRCEGKRFRLEEEPVRINGRGYYIWNRRGATCHEGTGGEDSPGRDGGKWTPGEIIIDILEHALGIPAAGSEISGHHETDCNVTDTFLTSADVAGYDAAALLALDSIIGEFSVDNTSIADAISLLLALNGGYYGWYIRPSDGVLTVIDLDAQSTDTLEAAEVGHWQDEAGTDYVLVNNELEWSLEGVVSTIVLQGVDRTVEVKPSNIEGSGSLAKNGGGELEYVNAPWRGFDAAYRPQCQPYRHPCGKQIDLAREFTPPEGWLSSDHQPRVYKGTTNGAKYAYWPSSHVTPKWHFYSGIIGFHEVPNLKWYEKLFGWYYARLPFTVTAGPDGDAYHCFGYERTRTIYDSTFKHPTSYPTPGTVDDITAMEILVERLLRIFKDVRRQGTFLCDGVSFADYTIGHRYSVENLGPPAIGGTTTTQGACTAAPTSWGRLKINALEIEWDFADNTTRLLVANTYWMLESYSELKRRLEQNLFAQRELDLSEDIFTCQIQDPGNPTLPPDHYSTTNPPPTQAPLTSTAPPPEPTTTVPPPPTTAAPGSTTSKKAGSTTSGAPGSTTSSEAPGSTTSGAPPGSTTTGCPSPSECAGLCANKYCVDLSAMDCGSFAGSCGEVELTYDSGCVWTGQDEYFVCGGDVECVGTGRWELEIAHGPSGDKCRWRKTALGDCPDGTYSHVGGDCDDCPGTVVVDTC